MVTNRDDDAEERLRELQRSLRAVADRLEGRRKWGRGRRSDGWRVASALALFAGANVVAGFLISPWSAALTLKHLGSIPNCDAVRAMGLAPTSAGHPGYWRHHDRNGDGVACQPLQSTQKVSVPSDSHVAIAAPDDERIEPEDGRTATSVPDDEHSAIRIVNGRILRRKERAVAAPDAQESPDRHAIIEIEKGKVRRSEK